MRAIGLAVILAACASTALAAPGWKRLDPAAYQSFVMNWTPDSAPFCAAMRSPAEWDAVMHPAPVMGPHKPFAPPASFWKEHAVLLIAKVVGGGDKVEAFTDVSVKGGAVAYRFQAPPSASFQVKSALMLAVSKPLAGKVRFIENGKPVCTVEPGNRSPS